MKCHKVRFVMFNNCDVKPYLLIYSVFMAMDTVDRLLSIAFLTVCNVPAHQFSFTLSGMLILLRKKEAIPPPNANSWLVIIFFFWKSSWMCSATSLRGSSDKEDVSTVLSPIETKLAMAPMSVLLGIFSFVPFHGLHLFHFELFDGHWR